LLNADCCTLVPVAVAGAGTGECVSMSLSLNSPSFEAGGAIPSRCTGEGTDESPSLTWEGAPPGTKAFALIVDDPDAPDPAAPKRTWVHWVVADMPPSTSALKEGASGKSMPSGSREGTNDGGETGYSGPMPPRGQHRYFFKLYALDAPTGLRDGCTKAELLKAIEGHVLATAELMGTYKRHG
jgi:Raf kinase inhibitor-like YbhB/YbcL family protein